MNEQEIASLFQNVKKRFVGVYAIDELLKTKLDAGEGLVFNTSPRNVSIGHWIALYKCENDKDVFLLDSLCLPYVLNNTHLKIFLKYNKIMSIKCLPYPVQHKSSNACGMFSIYFLYRLFKNEQLCEILNSLDSKFLYTNDFIVAQYIINYVLYYLFHYPIKLYIYFSRTFLLR